MSQTLLTVLIVACTVSVVSALFLVMWRARTSARTARVAVVSGLVLAGWTGAVAALAIRGSFLQEGPEFPPVGIALLTALGVLAMALSGSTSLRSLLSDQKSVLRLNVWRLVGVVFLILMAGGQMPALWALPAGIGDILVGVTAFWVARGLDEKGGKRRAVLFNLFGLADLVVAIGLGVTTGVGPAGIFHTHPTSELVTHFPLVLVPTFLVPLAFTLHFVSLWQLLGASWMAGPSSVPTDS